MMMNNPRSGGWLKTLASAVLLACGLASCATPGLRDDIQQDAASYAAAPAASGPLAEIAQAIAAVDRVSTSSCSPVSASSTAVTPAFTGGSH